MSAEEIVCDNCWNRGPDFLYQDEQNWPIRPPAMDLSLATKSDQKESESEDPRNAFASLVSSATIDIASIFKRSLWPGF